MNLNLNLNQDQKISNFNFIQKLLEALDNMQYFVVDRSEGNFTILENLYTHQRLDINTSELPPFLNDGDVLKKSGKNYEFNLQKTNELKKNISEKMNQLFNDK